MVVMNVVTKVLVYCCRCCCGGSGISAVDRNYCICHLIAIRVSQFVDIA